MEGKVEEKNGLRVITRIIYLFPVSKCLVDTFNIYNCYSGAYNNAGLVSMGGVITANVPPPPYTSAHKVAGMVHLEPV